MIPFTWTVFFSGIHNFFITVGGGIVTAIIAYWTLWKKFVRPELIKREQKKAEIQAEHIRKSEQTRVLIENQSRFFSHIDEMNGKLDWITRELKPNGGSSLRDEVGRISKDIRHIIAEKETSFQLSKDAMFKSDGDGNCIIVNSSMCRLFGATPEQLLGMGWLNFVVEEDRHRAREEWTTIIDDSGVELSTKYHIHNPLTNEVFPVKYRAIITRDINEEVVGVLGLVDKMKKPSRSNITVTAS